ncbi:hypothetical protein AC578_6149 [Pseudocercospora eumusae]|uniref:Uncharacterized protein n=1 Tax=Pseudocercospora eumusae TaxID=321146 RepID=A0A139H9A8_9PEZI|nr:hypothetical protein AC578_6149 [Pseudocercospora eumusae]
MPFAKQAFTAARRTITTQAMPTTTKPLVTTKLAVKTVAVGAGAVVAYDAVTKEQMEWSWKKN